MIQWETSLNESTETTAFRSWYPLESVINSSNRRPWLRYSSQQATQVKLERHGLRSPDLTDSFPAASAARRARSALHIGVAPMISTASLMTPASCSRGAVMGMTLDAALQRCNRSWSTVLVPLFSHARINAGSCSWIKCTRDTSAKISADQASTHGHQLSPVLAAALRPGSLPAIHGEVPQSRKGG